jgi:hypothetical protein
LDVAVRDGHGYIPTKSLDLLWGNAMKKTTAPIPFAGSQLDQTRHVSTFFNSADEEYQVLLPWAAGGQLMSGRFCAN